MKKEDILNIRKKDIDLSIEEKKMRDEYLKDLSLGNIQGPMTGYATIDKPWQTYFKMDKFYDIKNNKTIYQDILDNNKDNMDAVALIYFGAKITYKKMFENIDKTAKSLAAHGIKKGDYVTVCCAGIPECIYTVYALAKIGAIANLMAPYFDKDQMTDRINDCNSKLLICMDKFYPQIKDAVSKSSINERIIIPTLNSSPLRFIPSKDKFKSENDSEILWNKFIKDGENEKDPEVFEYEERYPLCMVYSSGTTGASKAIVLSHDSFQYSVLSYEANTVDVLRGQKMYQIIPPWYSTGFNTSIHLPLHKGLMIFQDPRFEREVFVKNIIKQKVDYAVAPTSMYEGFLDEKLVKGKKLTNFANPFEGGEPLTSEVKKQIEDSFKNMGVDSVIKIGYGQCECGAQATSQSQHIKHVEGSVGIPIPGVTIAIFDDDYNELTYNKRGNILVNTPCGMIEYFKNPKATSNYFYYDELNTKWSQTGDIGYMASNGDLFIEGRKEDFTLVNDKKVYNFDIENPIRTLPEIKNCDCIGKPSENGKDLGLHIIFSESQKNLYNDKDVLVEKLKEYQSIIYDKYNDIDMVPKYFKVRDEFPYKPSGKRDIESLGNETEGFIYIDNSYLVKNNFSRKRI